MWHNDQNCLKMINWRYMTYKIKILTINDTVEFWASFIYNLYNNTRYVYVSVSNPQFLSRLGLAGSREYKINEDILKYFGRILGGFWRILGGTATVFVPRTWNFRHNSTITTQYQWKHFGYIMGVIWGIREDFGRKLWGKSTVANSHIKSMYILREEFGRLCKISLPFIGRLVYGRASVGVSCIMLQHPNTKTIRPFLTGCMASLYV